MSRGEDAAGGRTRTPLLAGAFEALIGALYLDQGFNPARELVLRLVTPAAERIHHQRLDRDAKSMLQELSQGRLQVTPHIVSSIRADPTTRKSLLSRFS